MKKLVWNVLKSEKLKKERGASFDDVLNKGKLIAIQEHKKRENQKVMLFEYKSYIWLVPFVINKKGDIFLKTLYPSRKFTKKYFGDTR
ncbi:MAG: toxin [Nitrospinae bacterium]|nr:toxin [Nitrospinota bacterium]